MDSCGWKRSSISPGLAWRASANREKKKTQAFAKTEKETENQKDTSHAGTALDELDQWLASAAAEWLVWVSGG